MWGGMFVLAFFGGSWLGRYVVAGVDIGGAPAGANAMEMAAAPGLVHSNAVNAVAGRPGLKPIQVYNSSEHVCEGCDAGATRNRQMAERMGLPVYDESGDADSSDGDDDHDDAGGD